MSLKRKHDALFPPEELGPVIQKKVMGTSNPSQSLPKPVSQEKNFHKRLRECQQQNEKARQILQDKERRVIETCIQLQQAGKEKTSNPLESKKDLSTLDNRIEQLDFWSYLEQYRYVVDHSANIQVQDMDYFKKYRMLRTPEGTYKSSPLEAYEVESQQWITGERLHHYSQG